MYEFVFAMSTVGHLAESKFLFLQKYICVIIFHDITLLKRITSRYFLFWTFLGGSTVSPLFFKIYLSLIGISKENFFDDRQWLLRVEVHGFTNLRGVVITTAAAASSWINVRKPHKRSEDLFLIPAARYDTIPVTFYGIFAPNSLGYRDGAFLDWARSS